MSILKVTQTQPLQATIFKVSDTRFGFVCRDELDVDNCNLCSQSKDCYPCRIYENDTEVVYKGKGLPIKTYTYDMLSYVTLLRKAAFEYQFTKKAVYDVISETKPVKRCSICRECICANEITIEVSLKRRYRNIVFIGLDNGGVGYSTGKIAENNCSFCGKGGDQYEYQIIDTSVNFDLDYILESSKNGRSNHSPYAVPCIKKGFGYGCDDCLRANEILSETDKFTDAMMRSLKN